ncbi:DUF5715 family protein [Terriglobus sp.]|uniref:DUF5715 family protein n=1 Tax=Terriglobus sp. TaxID=1889013 RepID=UPI003AFFE29B
MPAASTVFTSPAAARPAAAMLRLLPDALESRPSLTSLRRRVLLRAALVPLAFAAVMLPAHGAGHRFPARSAAHPAAAHKTASASIAAPTKRTGATRIATVLAAAQHGSHAAAKPLSPATSRHGRVAVAAHPLSRSERRQAEAQERQQALYALQERSLRHTSPHSLAARSSARIEVSQDLPKPHPRNTSVSLVSENGDAPADSRIQDRVHAWYRAHQPDAASDNEASGDADTHAPSRQAPARILATVTPNAQPDLSPAPHKATTADFTHAAAVQRETIAAARDQQAHQTTSADDNADAESRIPSTAPTEREPAPFVHGSFGAAAHSGDHEDSGVPAANLSTSRSQRQPAPSPLPAPLPANIVRQAPAAATSIAPPQHVDLKHRGDGLSSAIAADEAAQASRAAASHGSNSNIPVATAADSSPRAIRALAEQTANSPTPALKLPAPPSGALRKELPAVAAVESGARRRELDPAVTSGMAEETFDENDTPATARTAIALAAPSPIAGLVPARTHAIAASDEGDANLPAAAMVSVNLFDRHGRLILVPPMKGSHEILVHQNQMAVADGLDRIQDDRDLLDLRQRKLLVALPDEDSTYPDDRLPANRRYARPWTIRFLRDLAKSHYARFGTPLIVTSAARTVEFQRRLVRVNGNAAPPTGDIASPHLYGQAIDIGKGRMGLTELTWMRAYLTPVENDGKIDVEEEFQQSCFHISVYRRYLGLPTPHRTAPPAQNTPAPLLTAKEAPATDVGKPAEKKHRRISAAMLATGLR